MFKIFAMALVALASSTAFAQAPAGMEIRYVQANGSGCPDGSAFIDVSPDKQVFTAIFSSFQAAVGPGISPLEKNKYCAMILNVKVPAGWQYSIFRAKYEGWFDLERGVKLTQTSKYWFQGNSPVVKSSTMVGPQANTFNYEDSMGVESWSPCGGTRNMIINANLVLNNNANRNGTGIAGIDSIEGAFDLRYSYYVQYRRCH